MKLCCTLTEKSPYILLNYTFVMKKILAHYWRYLRLPKHIQFFIMRFLNDEFLVGVIAVIFNNKNQILLLEHTYRQTPWSLPGGYLKAGEHPKEGAEREIREETSMKVKVDKLLETSTDPQTARLEISCYGKFISGKFKPSDEVINFGFFDYDSLPMIGKRQKKLIEKAMRYSNRSVRLSKKQQLKKILLNSFYKVFSNIH